MMTVDTRELDKLTRVVWGAIYTSQASIHMTWTFRNCDHAIVDRKHYLFREAGADDT